MGQRFMGVGMVATIVGVYILVFFIANNFLPQDDRYKTVAEFIQLATAVLAIVFAGILAAVKLELFRDFEPHLTITHSIKHRHISQGHVHMDVTVVLQNSSRVKVKLQDGYFVLQQILLTTEASGFSPEILYPSWPVLDQASFDLGDSAIVIEPGQSIQEVLQFNVPDAVKAILVHYFFYDARFPSERRSGWGITEVYDILDK